MTDLDDLELDKAHAVAQLDQPRRWKPFAALVAALVVIAGAALLWNYFASRKTPPSGVRVKTESVGAPQSAERPRKVEGEDIPLPPLNDTDALVRQLVGRLSSHPRIAAWLTTDQLIRN